MAEQWLGISFNELRLPAKAFDRAGRVVGLMGSEWRLNSATRPFMINWRNFPENAAMLFPAAAKYIVYLISVTVLRGSPPRY